MALKVPGMDGDSAGSRCGECVARLLGSRNRGQGSRGLVNDRPGRARWQATLRSVI